MASSCRDLSAEHPSVARDLSAQEIVAKRQARKPTISDQKTIEELLGHANVATTMIYTHVLNRPGLTARSPADLRRIGLPG